MLTPQEVAEHAFAKASFGGYNMAMVDEFLDLLTADYTALYKENAALKAKMKVLADKVEEYRSTEDAMRKALLAAQKMADQMVIDAEQQKSAILAAAKKEASGKLTDLRQETANEQARLSAAQNATASYVSKLKDLCRHEMEYLANLSHLTPPSQKGEVAELRVPASEPPQQKALEESPSASAPPVQESLYQELLRNPNRRLAPEQPEQAPEQESAPALEKAEAENGESSEPTRRIGFDHLQFGKDYTIG